MAVARYQAREDLDQKIMNAKLAGQKLNAARSNTWLEPEWSVEDDGSTEFEFTAVKAPNHGGVYYIVSRAPSGLLVKIGYAAKSISSRVRALGCAHPWKLDLVAFEAYAPKKVEHARHTYFANERIREAAGVEWFSPSRRLASHIAKVRARTEVAS